MDLKFINSEYFFILSAIIKEMDDDEGMDLPQYDFNYFYYLGDSYSFSILHHLIVIFKQHQIHSNLQALS